MQIAVNIALAETNGSALQLSEQCHAFISTVKPAELSATDRVSLLEKVGIISLTALATHTSHGSDFKLLLTPALHEKYVLNSRLLTSGVLLQSKETLEKLVRCGLSWLHACAQSAVTGENACT